ncbi:PrpF domain-containing protein [Streptomyces avermitilis]|uniref:PrpF domain-containing protein n=1 Tax=Streptomyces avermitilis TaxID=33903 RepID=UPI0036923340
MTGTREVRCMLMRGGTSKGAYFLAEDLPADADARDDLLLRVMGSPDPRQIDGLGGAHPLTERWSALAALFRGNLWRTTLLFWLASFCGLLLVYGVSNWLPTMMRGAGYELGSSLSFRHRHQPRRHRGHAGRRPLLRSLRRVARRHHLVRGHRRRRLPARHSHAARAHLRGGLPHRPVPLQRPGHDLRGGGRPLRCRQPRHGRGLGVRHRTLRSRLRAVARAASSSRARPRAGASPPSPSPPSWPPCS